MIQEMTLTYLPYVWYEPIEDNSMYEPSTCNRFLLNTLSMDCLLRKTCFLFKNVYTLANNL